MLLKLLCPLGQPSQNQWVGASGRLRDQLTQHYKCPYERLKGCSTLLPMGSYLRGDPFLTTSLFPWLIPLTGNITPPLLWKAPSAGWSLRIHLSDPPPFLGKLPTASPHPIQYRGAPKSRNRGSRGSIRRRELGSVEFPGGRALLGPNTEGGE